MQKRWNPSSSSTCNLSISSYFYFFFLSLLLLLISSFRSLPLSAFRRIAKKRWSPAYALHPDWHSTGAGSFPWWRTNPSAALFPPFGMCRIANYWSCLFTTTTTEARALLRPSLVLSRVGTWEMLSLKGEIIPLHVIIIIWSSLLNPSTRKGQSFGFGEDSARVCTSHHQLALIWTWIGLRAYHYSLLKPSTEYCIITIE